MSRDSRTSFADYPANASSVMQQGRKKSFLDSRKPPQPYVGPTSLVWTSPSVKARSANRQPYPSSAAAASADGKPFHTHNASSVAAHGRDDDDVHRDDAGDLLNGVGSASSHASTASSIFSNHVSSSSMPAAGASSIHALTPLTNSSPPGKAGSPMRSHARTSDDAQVTSAVAFDELSAVNDEAQDAADAITPIHTPPENRLQARPGPGEEKGFKLVYDPERDKELTKEQRKRRVAEPIKFGQGVSAHAIHTISYLYRPSRIVAPLRSIPPFDRYIRPP